MAEPDFPLLPASPQAQELAAAAAHALNNTIGVLYAAASYLELPGTSGPDRATRAVSDATCGARALSAALGVLALGPADIEAVRGRPAMQLGGEDLARIQDALSEVGAVRWADAPATHAQTALQVDAHTLQSVLLCAVWWLRRMAGPQAVLEGTLGVAGTPGQGELAVRLHAAGVSQGAPGRSHHPCEWALGHASALLGPLGLSLANTVPGVVELRCRPVAT